MALNKDKSLALIIVSVFIFVINSMGLLMARFTFDAPKRLLSADFLYYLWIDDVDFVSGFRLWDFSEKENKIK